MYGGIINALNRIVEKLGALVISIGGDQKDYACMVKRNTVQAIATATWTTILHNVKNADPENGFDTATGKYTVQIAGFYTISAKAVFAVNATGNWRICSIYKNNIEFLRGTNSGAAFSVTVVPISVVSATVYLEKGDVLENKVYQDSGGALNSSSDSVGGENFFSIAKINKYNGSPSSIGVTAKIDLSAAQSIPNAAFQKVAYNRTLYTRGDITVDLVNNRIRVNSGGIYAFNAYIAFTDSALGSTRGLDFRKNGANIDISSQVFLDKDPTGRFRFAAGLECMANKDDYFEFMVYQDSGAALNLNSSNMSITKISD